MPISSINGIWYLVLLLKAGKSILTMTYVNYEWTVEHVLVVHVLMSSALALLPEAALLLADCGNRFPGSGVPGSQVINTPSPLSVFPVVTGFCKHSK